MAGICPLGIDGKHECRQGDTTLGLRGTNVACNDVVHHGETRCHVESRCATQPHHSLAKMFEMRRGIGIRDLKVSRLRQCPVPGDSPSTALWRCLPMMLQRRQTRAATRCSGSGPRRRRLPSSLRLACMEGAPWTQEQVRAGGFLSGLGDLRHLSVSSPSLGGARGELLRLRLPLLRL
jgi:hypothetical protein